MTPNLHRFSLLIAVVALPLAATALDVPDSPRGSVVHDYHGTPVADPYAWLEDLDAPETRAWVQAQNALSLPTLAALPERAGFRQRLAELWNYERVEDSEKTAGRIFFTRNTGLENQARLFVQEGAREPRLLLDPNTLSAAGTTALTQTRASPDGRWLAYGLAAAGSDWNELRVRRVDNGEDAPETLTRIKFSEVSWTRDSQGFFYSRYPLKPERPDAASPQTSVFDELSGQRLYYHRVGRPQSEDLMIFEWREEPKGFVDGQVTEDGRYLFITLRRGSGNDNALYYSDLGDPLNPALQAPTVKLIDRHDAQFTVLGNRGPVIVLLTNRDSPRRRIISIDLRRPAEKYWRTLVAEHRDTLEQALIADGQLVLLYMHDAASRLARHSLSGQALPAMALPGLGTVSGLRGSADDRELFFSYTAFNTPQTRYSVDLRNGRLRPFQALKPGFDPAEYVTEQVFYTSRDSTRIPMFISYRKGLRKDGHARTFLHGYGGFDIPKTPVFDASALAWMERGGVYAVANLRGGGEYGEAWHEAGTRARKQNVFDDFVAAAGYLIDRGYTSSELLAIWGRSNGGLLVGASVNQHPGLWSAAVATVGVMDMLRFHKFTVGYAWIGDYGSSDDPEGFRYLSAYSPLHTIRDGLRYPATLVMTGDHDDRVHPAHSYKYAAALQAAQAGDAPVLIRIDIDAGHGSGKPVSKIIEEEADKLAFMWHYTGGAP